MTRRFASHETETGVRSNAQKIAAEVAAFDADNARRVASAARSLRGHRVPAWVDRACERPARVYRPQPEGRDRP